MNITLENALKDEKKTFSAEAVYMFQKSVKDLVMRIVAVACQNGFDKGETVHKIDFDLNVKVNDKEMDLDKLFEQYPDLLGFDMNMIKKIILREDGSVGSGKTVSFNE